MEQAPGLMESVEEIGESLDRAPQLLVEVEPWHRVFFRNLTDSVWTQMCIRDSDCPAAWRKGALP